MSGGLKEMQILKTTQSGFTGKLYDFKRTLIGSVHRDFIKDRALQNNIDWL